MLRTFDMPRHYETKNKNGRHGPSTGVAYCFYVVLYSMPAIQKLDKIIIATQKPIYRLPICMSNAITQLPQNLYGLDAFSFENAYLRCIGEQLQNTLNDKGPLGKIYNSLTRYILVKHGGFQNKPRNKTYNCLKSPITRTLFVLKHEGKLHLKSTHQLSLDLASLEQAWVQEMQNEPQVDNPQAYKLLQKLLFVNITDLKQIILTPNGSL